MQHIISTVQSRAYRLLKPGKIEEITIEREVQVGEVVVEPSLASICHADLRYYLGHRRPEAITRKLPMALLHEGIGKVVESRSNKLQVGQRVVIVPNIPGYLLGNGNSKECSYMCGKEFVDNYSEKNEFLGSGYDGIAQHRLVLPEECAISIPEDIPDEIAVLSELSTVSYRALSNVRKQLQSPNTKVAIFGDGPVGYLTAALLYHTFGLDNTRLTVFGAIAEKLDHFVFANRALVQDYNFNEGEKVDVVIECTGGSFSESAINQGIDILARGGALILMGVSEQRVPINTRDVLEKGLSLYGSSRSSFPDYHAVLTEMRSLQYQKTLRSILPKNFTSIPNVDSFKKAMEDAGINRKWKKVILELKW